MNAPTDIIDALRQATDDLHQQLHHHPVLAPLASVGTSLYDYKIAMASFHAAYTLCESCKYYALENIEDVPTLAWLQRDIRFHVIQPMQEIVIDFPVIDTPSKAIGYAYVKQGSTLGGRVISKNLHAQLGLIEGISNCFFAGYGDTTGEKWKKFIQALSATGWNNGEVCTQARATFMAIKTACDAAMKLKSRKPD